MSVRRMRVASTTPPKYPEINPITVPSEAPMSVASAPTRNDVRMPCMILRSRSLPRESVPSRPPLPPAHDGASSRLSSLGCDASRSEMIGISIEDATNASTTTIAPMMMGRRRSSAHSPEPLIASSPSRDVASADRLRSRRDQPGGSAVQSLSPRPRRSPVRGRGRLGTAR